ncbi:MAG TPA: hypothetical protein VFV58_11415 [Blastocatellia bacterium]|jgi:hypothetical protein|nr:hypothetical protein [Blastocatellia bacterium]
MKTLIYTAPLLITLSLSVLAQASDSCRGQGYLFIAPGVAINNYKIGSGPFVHAGIGGEGFVYKGFGVGAEIGGFGSDEVIGIGSANVSYHFLPGPTERKIEPFVSAGYTLFFRAGLRHGGNIGLGINRWLNKDVALRFEVRDNLQGAGGRLIGFRHSGHLIGFRMGVTFR